MNSQKKLVIGLTGGIGSGKTAVSDRFAQQGITIVDADIASRTVVEPPSKALNAIAERFGSHFLLDSGELDRAQLRSQIFNHPEDKTWLEALLHPLIRDEILQQLNNAASPYVILVSPLLFESNQYQLCQRNLVVDVPVETQISRTVSRDNNDIDQVKRIIASQISRKDRLAKADDIIENIYGFERLDKEVALLHQQYLMLANQS